MLVILFIGFIKIITSLEMYSPQISDRDMVRLPKIANKSKSMPGNIRSNSRQPLSAKAWFYYSPNAQFGFKSSAKREIASITKVMTAICTLDICQKYNMSLKSTYFKVTRWASVMNGTTADLQQNAWMTIEDLLYGLMLPSGNDAATVLCQNLGAVLYFDKMGNKSMIEEIRSIDLTEDHQSIRFYNLQFIAYMNNKAKMLRMYKTRFANPHGLDHINNYSCCEDVYLMCREAMANGVFRKIVKAQTHKGIFKFFKDGKVVCRPMFWSNTNKLLERSEVVGIKTGITSKAGGCLATTWTLDNKQQAYIIVLGCNSAEARFKDTAKVMNWGREEEDLSNTS